MSAAFNWYQKNVVEKIAENDAANRTSADDSLRLEWQADYRLNMNSIKAFMDTVPTDDVPFFEAIMGARGPDGRLLRDNPAIHKAMLHIAEEINPSGTLMPGTGQLATVQSLEAEKAAIEKEMGTPAYLKDPRKQERYREVVDHLLKRGGKAA